MSMVWYRIYTGLYWQAKRAPIGELKLGIATHAHIWLFVGIYKYISAVHSYTGEYRNIL